MPSGVPAPKLRPTCGVPLPYLRPGSSGLLPIILRSSSVDPSFILRLFLCIVLWQSEVKNSSVLKKYKYSIK